MEKWADVVAYAKNTQAGMAFNIEYQNSQGLIASYYTDFLVRTTDNRCYAVELKGIEEDDARLKRERLRLWCENANRTRQDGEPLWSSIYILQSQWEKYLDKLRTFDDVVQMFEVK